MGYQNVIVKEKARKIYFQREKDTFWLNFVAICYYLFNK